MGQTGGPNELFSYNHTNSSFFFKFEDLISFIKQFMKQGVVQLASREML